MKSLRFRLLCYPLRFARPPIGGQSRGLGKLIYYLQKNTTCGDFLAICSLASAIFHRCGVTFSQVR